MPSGGDDEAPAVVVDVEHHEAGDKQIVELVLEGRTR